MKGKRRLALAGLASALAVAGLTWLAIDRVGDRSADGGCSRAGLDYQFPYESFRDWVSFADQLSVFQVADEAELPPQVSEDPDPQDYVGRTVTLRIERTVWRRRPEAPSAPHSIPYVTWGWSIEDGERRRARVECGAPWLEVGKRYVAPLVRARGDRGREWFPLAGPTIFPLDGATITDEGIVGDEPSPLLRQVVGRSVDDLGSRLDRTPLYPLAIKYARRSPEDRVTAVLAAEDG